VVINGKPVSVDDNANPQKCFAIDSAMHGQYFITRLGKKKVHLFTVV
jgi:tyrosyl-tRNA synthetase